MNEIRIIENETNSGVTVLINNVVLPDVTELSIFKDSLTELLKVQLKTETDTGINTKYTFRFNEVDRLTRPRPGGSVSSAKVALQNLLNNSPNCMDVAKGFICESRGINSLDINKLQSLSPQEKSTLLSVFHEDRPECIACKEAPHINHAEDCLRCSKQ